MAKVLIVEDEPSGANFLKMALETYHPELEILDLAFNLQQAREALTQHSPDLVFLDIHLPDGDGFQLLKDLPLKRPFEVIFTTAYQNYAIRAFEYAALQYLLKPIGLDALAQAIERWKQVRTPPQAQQLGLVADLLHKPSLLERIAIPSRGEVDIIPIKSIIRCEADRNYTQIFLQQGRKLLSSKSLLHYEKLLSEVGFLRVHDKHLVNLQVVCKYIRGLGGSLLLDNGETIEVSARKKEVVLKVLGLS